MLKLTTDAQGASVVSARELYETLGFDVSQWSRWYKKNILSNPYALEGEDWQQLDIMSSRGNGAEVAAKDYALTTDFAERLCMLARTDKGEEVRRWFQSLKKLALQQTASGPLPYQLQRQGQLLLEHHELIEQLRWQVDQLMAGRRPRRSAPASLSRQMVIQRVEHYVHVSGASVGEVYHWLYGRLQQVFDVDLQSLPRQEGESLLDVADRHDCLHRLLGLIESELQYTED